MTSSVFGEFAKGECKVKAQVEEHLRAALMNDLVQCFLTDRI